MVDRRTRFDLFVSQIVITEASGGDADAASKRLAELEGIPVLAVTSEAVDLAGRFVKAHAMPEKAAVDALHVAVAVVNVDGLRANVELHAHRERRDTGQARADMPGCGLRTAGHLHPGRTDGMAPMADDPVIEETRRIRERFAKTHGYDLQRIARALQDEESKGGRKLVTRAAKRRERRRRTG